MATRSAGRVTIRVIPDSTSFRRDLRTALERVENTMEAKIPAKLTLTRESIAELKAQLRDLQVRIKIEPYVTKEDLHNLKKNIEDVDPDVRVGLNTGIAAARLAYLTRDREVTIFARVNKASVLAAAETLAALSGARLLGNVFENFWDSIKNLDKSAPRIAAISTGFIALGSILGAAVSNVAGLAASFAQLGQTAVLLPALLTGAGISIGVLIAAFKDMKTVLADLAPAFHTLQDNISAKFWKEAAQPIRDMVNTLLPTLNRELGQLATAWGRVIGALANEIKGNVTPEELTKMMGNLTRAVDIAARAMKPLVAAFNTLGSFGSEYLPRLSEWFVKLSDQFNNFIQDASKDGSLKRWAEQGITAFKDLGRVLKETVRVFAALSRAATAAGGSSFAQLADGLKKLADTMNNASFQTTLTTILFSAHLAVDGLIDGLNRLGPGLANFAPTIARVFGEVGKILGQFGEDLGALLSSPELQTGLVRFFSGFLTFLTDLKPAMKPLGEIVGVIGDIAGTLLSSFGPVLTEAIKELAKVFSAVWQALKPLVPVLSDLVIKLLPSFSEILMVIAKDVLPELVPLIAELAPIFADLLIAFAPVLVEFLKNFAAALKEMKPYIKPIAEAIKDLSDAFKGLPLAFYQAGTGNMGGFIGTMATFMKEHPNAAAILGGIGQAVLTLKDSIKSFGEGMGFINFLLQLGAALQGPTGIIQGVIDLAAGIVNLSATKGGWDAFWGTLGDILAKITPIGTAFQIMVTFIQNGVAGVVALTAPWQMFWSNLTNPVNIAIALVTGLLTSAPNTWLIAIVTGVARITAFWTTYWPTLIPTIVTAFVNFAASINRGFPAMIASVVIGMSNILQSFARGWLTIIGQIPGWFGAIAGGVSAGISIVVARVFGLPNSMLAVLFGYAGRFAAAGESLIRNFAQGISRGSSIAEIAIKAVIAAVTKHLPGSPAKVGPLSGRGYSLLRGQRMVEDFASGMKDRTAAVQSASLGVASAVQFGDASASFASAGSATGGSSPLVNIEGDYYGATPEEVANDLDKKIRRNNVVYNLTGVK